MNSNNVQSGSRTWELLSDQHRPPQIPTFPAMMSGGHESHQPSEPQQPQQPQPRRPLDCWQIEPFTRQSYAFRFCPNSANPYHRCSGYCAVRYAPPAAKQLDPQVYPNIANPYHRHMIYCMAQHAVQLDPVY